MKHHLLHIIILVVASGLWGCSDSKKSTVVEPKPPASVAPKDGQAGADQPGSPKTDGGSSGRNLILQMPFDNVAKVVMLNIGKAYEFSLASGKPPRDIDELGAKLTTFRDQKKRDVEVLYGVDPKKLPEDGANHMLAWEKEPTNDGNRMVLMADCRTVKYLNEEEFKKTPKAK